MFKKVVAALAIVPAIAIILGFFLPDAVEMRREIVIAATPDEIFPFISDYNAFNRWSPWADRDPAAVYEITGSGVGQRMTWRSDNPDVGSGAQTLVEIAPPSRAVSRLEFDGMGKAMSAIELSPVEGGTRVTWSFETKMRDGAPIVMQPIATYMGFFMEGMVGPDYEEGLARLKTAVEGQADV